MKTHVLKYFFFAIIFTSFYSNTFSQIHDLSDQATLERIKFGIGILASDSLLGREAGTKGEVMAAEFIASEFEKSGVEKLIGDSTYFQYFDFRDGVTYQKNTYLMLNGKKYQLDKDFYPLSISANKEVEGTIVNAGKGIVDTATNTNDFAKTQVENPIFVIEMTADANSKSFSMFVAQKADEAMQNNGKALILINNNPEFSNPKAQFKEAMQIAGIPVIFVDQSAKKVILDATSPKAKLKVSIVENTKQGLNVVGEINNNAEHTIIIGAHFDHLGMGGRTSRYRGEEALVHNGADDNASGVMGVVELAKFIKNNENLKNFNYIFIAFSAEEKGLIGSSRFANSDLYEPEKTNCMINLDMIGRIDTATKKLYIMGTGTSPIWDSLLNNLPLAEKLDINGVPSGMGGSDHTSFYLQDIPSLFFFTGMHQDYHTPTDDIEKLYFEGEVEILNYIEQLLVALNKENKLEFTKTNNPSQEKVRHSGVTMGFMPDFAYNGQGVRINAITDNKPAAKAGLQNGDVIIKIDDLEIKEIQTYMKALRNFEKGDTVVVTALREEKEITKKVTF